MACAAVAAGADGIIVEVHEHPELALSDGQQSLRPSKFGKLMETILPLLNVMGKVSG
jgi:3-deoxy-7-phosphoheptulonate synthase